MNPWTEQTRFDKNSESMGENESVRAETPTISDPAKSRTLQVACLCFQIINEPVKSNVKHCRTKYSTGSAVLDS